MIINKIQGSCTHLFPINHLVNYLIFHKKNLFLKTFDSELSYIKIWFTDHNSKLLEIKNKLNITLVIKV